MDPALEGLKPETLWKHFAHLFSNAQGGDPLANHLLAAAKDLGAEATADGAGNVLVRKPASPGREKSPSLCLHCFVEAPRPVRAAVSGEGPHPRSGAFARAGDLLSLPEAAYSAKELVATAALLAILEERRLEHGPLELLFTFARKDGSSSLAGLDPGALRSRTLIDLSFGEEGALCTGCAGWKETSAVWRIEREEPRRGSLGAEIRVAGLRGGHADRNLGKGRGNAIKILARACARIQELGGRISAIDAPGALGEIPREASALIVFPRSLPRRAEPALKQLTASLRDEFGAAEPSISVQLSGSNAALKPVFRRHIQKKILRATMALPCGVIRANPLDPRRIEASANLASISTEEDSVCLRTVQRSSVPSLLSDLAESVQGIFLLAGAKLCSGAERAPWRADPRSRLLRAARAACEAIDGKPPEETTTHETLECALLHERIRGLEMVSLGPAVAEAGTSRESVDVSSVERLWRVLVEILKRVV